MSAVEAAYIRVSAGHPAEGRALLETAGRSGDSAAFRELAFWYLRGDIIDRDVVAARHILCDAAIRGDAEAGLIAAALAGNGSGGSINWMEAVGHLERAAEVNNVAAAQYAALSKMSLKADGTPQRLPILRSITRTPAIWHVSGLLTPVECQHIATAAIDRMEPAGVFDPKTGQQILSTVRTSDAGLIGPTHENLVIRAINLRLAAITKTRVGQGEALTVLRYRLGQQFRMHTDSLPNTRNQRVMTALVYLNDNFEGGETVFPDYSVTIRPVTGDALIFTNTLPDGRPDPRARHAGQPVTSGVKWLATRWIRARPFDVWTGPEAV